MPLFPLLPNVAIIDVQGRIGRALRPDDIIGRLELARRLPFIKAVLVRIESPGGDASDSEEIRAAVAAVAEDKFVLAHIARVGASGGYLIAAAADKITATKWALVGSIGVIVMRPNVTDLLERIGVDVVVRKTGRFKDLGSPFRTPTVEDEVKEAELIDDIYRDFVATVAAGRDLEPAAVEKLATGEVFTAAKAAEFGLIDDVGDERKAIEIIEHELGRSARTVELRVPGGSAMRRLRPAALMETFGGPLASLSYGPRLEWPGGRAR